MATRLLPECGGQADLSEPPALLASKAKTRTSYLHHNYLQTVETRSALSQEFCEDE